MVVAHLHLLHLLHHLHAFGVVGVHGIQLVLQLLHVLALLQVALVVVLVKQAQKPQTFTQTAIGLVGAVGELGLPLVVQPQPPDLEHVLLQRAIATTAVLLALVHQPVHQLPLAPIMPGALGLHGQQLVALQHKLAPAFMDVVQHHLAAVSPQIHEHFAALLMAVGQLGQLVHGLVPAAV